MKPNNALPVIVRELRLQSRQASTYGLRATGVAALLGVGAAAVLAGSLGLKDGGKLFAQLHLTLFWAIWILVPLMTADCISRERREGTLPLLLLTRLTGRDIVLAKATAHGLRAITLGLAAVPVMVVPFVLGGVDWMEVGVSASVHLSSFCWALAAGMLATSHTRSQRSALVWAALWSLIFLGTMMVLFGAVTWAVFVFTIDYSFEGDMNLLRFFFEVGKGLALEHNVAFELIRWFRVPWKWAPLVISGVFLLVSWLGLRLCLALAGRGLRAPLQNTSPSAGREKLERIFCTPAIAKDWFRRWMLRKIERNPIGWLEQRTWQSRLVTWAWLAVLVSIYSMALAGPGTFAQILDLNHRLFSHLLLGSMALTAAGSFRRERESGVMELLLVSTLSYRQVIWGRLRGIWGQFMPAMIMLVTVWIYMAWFVDNPRAYSWNLFLNRTYSWNLFFIECLSAGSMVAGFATVPVIGLYFSLRCRHHLVALVLTIATGMLTPAMVSQVGDRVWHAWLYSGWDMSLHPVRLAMVYLAPALVPFGLAAFHLRQLGLNLVSRNFALGREAA